MIFNIENLNYVIIGSNQKIVNIDILSTNAEMETSKACMTFVTDEGADTLDDGSSLSSTAARRYLSAEYRTHRIKRLDETAEKILSVSDGKDTIYALFDVKDVAVKCLNRESPMGISYSEDDCHIIYSKELKNVFNSHMDKDPIGFCMQGDEAVGLAFDSTMFPAMMKTNLEDTRYDRLVNGQNSLDWFFKIGSEANDIYTYIPLSNLVKNHLSDDPISTWIDPEGYYLVAKSYKGLSNEIFDNFFINRFNHLSVETNQIVRICLEGTGDPNRAAFNDFNNGIVMGRTFVGKNAYDAEYSMNMKTVEDLNSARNYIGLGNVGGQVFLKYYDETDYEGSDISATSLSSIDLQTVESVKHSPYENSYQNVEILDALVGLAGNSSANHKSNLYSIWVKNTGLNTETDDELSKYKGKIRAEVTNSIRVIAESLAPAHTQLFDVFYKDS